VSGFGPPDDPSEAPTGLYDYGDGDGEEGVAPPGSPWYRKPIVSLILGLFAAMLLGLVIYLLADLTRGKGGTTQTPTSPTMSTGVTTFVTTSEPTTTEPVAPAPTTTLTFPPSTTTEPTSTAPTTTSPPSTTIEDGRHHHHHRDDGATP
jgi:hypothetical protein